MKVNLTYFKPLGKFYTDASYETSADSLLDIWGEVREMLEQRKLPGLSEGGSGDWLILVDAPEAPGAHPKLIIGSEGGWPGEAGPQ